MTLVYCRHCGGQVDGSTATCPHCAAAQPPTPTSPAAHASTYQQLGSDMAIALYVLGNVVLVVWLMVTDNFGDLAIGGLILANAVIAPMLAKTLSQRKAPAVQEKPPIGTVAPAPPTGAVGFGWRLFRWGVNLVLLTALAALIACSGYWFFDEPPQHPKAPLIMVCISILIASPLAFLIRRTVTLPLPLHEALRRASRVMLWTTPTFFIIALKFPDLFAGLPLIPFAACYQAASSRAPGLKLLWVIPLLLVFLFFLYPIIILIISIFFDNSYVDPPPDGY